jgi:hypothetical protein
MNRIQLDRVLLAGLATLVAFFLLELLWEGLILGVILGDTADYLRSLVAPPRWAFWNHALNLAIAVFNCFILIWLYASLRPMFGVGPRTAIIASAFVFVFVTAFEVNTANLGFIPYQYALADAVNLAIELPLSLIAGAQVYESGRWVVTET